MPSMTAPSGHSVPATAAAACRIVPSPPQTTRASYNPERAAVAASARASAAVVASEASTLPPAAISLAAISATTALRDVPAVVLKMRKNRRRMIFHPVVRHCLRMAVTSVNTAIVTATAGVTRLSSQTQFPDWRRAALLPHSVGIEQAPVKWSPVNRIMCDRQTRSDAGMTRIVWAALEPTWQALCEASGDKA